MTRAGEPPEMDLAAVADRGDRVPAPDPTRLTTQALHRALAGLRELIEIRLEGMDKATERLATDTAELRRSAENNRELQREDVERQLAALREFLMTKIDGLETAIAQRFNTVGIQFSERDERLRLADIERQKSLDAALAAQKSDVNLQNLANTRAAEKAETAAKESISSLGELTSSSLASLGEQIRRVESRLDRGEATQVGATTQRTESRLDAGQVVSYVVMALLAVGLAVSLLAR